MASLQRKIHFTYYALAAALAAFALVFFADLSFLEDRIATGVSASELLDTVLEARRYEKNFFLYGKTDDLRESRGYGARASALLTELQGELESIASRERIGMLRQRLAEYLNAIDGFEGENFWQSAAGHARAQTLREAGRLLSAEAEAMADAQRARLAEAVRESRWWLLGGAVLIALTAVVIARRVARSVALPLARVESALADIGRGHFDHLDPPSQDREILSVTDAVNRMLSEIESRRRHLVQSEKLASLGTLVSGVAHELNNPLSNISSTAQILLEEVDADAHIHDWLTQIDQETERARRVVRMLLAFARDEAFRKQRLTLREVIDESLFLLRGHRLRREAVTLEIPGDLEVPADRQRLQQVIVNLLRNAVDAAGEAARIRVRAQAVACDTLAFPPDTVFGKTSPSNLHGDRCVVLSIEDDGPGISPDILPRVFDPFFTTKDVGHGSGLGLFVSQEIVAQHDGCLGVSSRLDAGTCFTLCLPLDEPEEVS
jgi:signal transduction histidine kinase